jgi:predicted DNA-binding protein with PD1-like motif
MTARSWVALTAAGVALSVFLVTKELAVAADDTREAFVKPTDIKPDKAAPGMHAKELSDHSWAVIFSAGDEVVSGLTKWAAERQVKSAHVTAIGALRSAVVGYYDLNLKAYRVIPINEQVELLSLIGDFAIIDGKPSLHAHVVVGRRDGSTGGGHLIEGYASPTAEVFVTTYPAELHKQPDEASGLDLITIGH